MRWLTRPLPPPEPGTIQHFARFAWKPTQVGKFTVWLEPWTVIMSYSAEHGWQEIARDVRNSEYPLTEGKMRTFRKTPGTNPSTSVKTPLPPPPPPITRRY